MTMQSNRKLNLEEVRTQILELHINKLYYSPITANKGSVGLLLEKINGIQSGSSHLDFEDGEMKAFPLKRLKNGTIVPKETISITMINEKNLLETPFTESGICSKSCRILFVPYLRDGDFITYMEPVVIDMLNDTHLREQIQEDYEFIRNEFITHGELKTYNGKHIQSRQKGAGAKKRPPSKKKTFSFYFRTNFIKEFLIMQ